MSSSERYERTLPTLLEELSAPRTPDYFDDILGQVGRTRQRPGWTFPERWLPMSAVTERLATAPRAPVRAIVLVAILVLALVAALAIIAGSQRPRVPAPFGPADNGRIAFVDLHGAVRTGLPTASTFDLIADGPGNESPVFSRDGTRLVYLHPNAMGNMDIVVANPDGSHAVTINTDDVLSAQYVGWTPDGSSVVLESQPGKLVAYDASRPGPGTVLVPNFAGGSVGFGDRVASVFRPPLGDEIAFLGSGPEGDGLYATKRDGSGIRPLLTPKTGGLTFASLASPEWSPDGRQIAVSVHPPVDDESRMSIYVMNADGSGIRRASPGCTVDTSENFPAWSPDGTQIAVMRWCSGGGADDGVKGITVIDVATGTSRGVGYVALNGYNGFAWSPDGESIFEVPGSGVDDARQLLVVDVATGAITRTGQSSDAAPNWQRTARNAP